MTDAWWLNAISRPPRMFPPENRHPNRNISLKSGGAWRNAGAVGQVVKIHDDINGWRVHHVRALGKANEKPLIWDYFLCTAKSGQQTSLIFSYAEEDEKLVAGSPEQMVGTLTVRANRPKVALPR